ncbi:hypothetical protein MmiHf6_05440 [Methanimicrococcus hongohii]|uniref:Uncharacterized protein n=1 Tax=Methanimicrococcus hongohii TaxID=3028295 RepID=A0AA96ZSB5_9EURY|nr:hypothetical protein [Methanimicrococcus sp. Hf6]WNY23239.1 hypothetical protein MmiHf6_05440 [Methanimicrococcus sp. Hf6]
MNDFVNPSNFNHESNHKNENKSKSENNLLNILKSFITVIVYFVAVFYTCYFISFVSIYFSMMIYDFSNPELFTMVAGMLIYLIIGGIEFHRAFRGKWTLVTFVLFIPIIAGAILKGILHGTKKIQFDIRPPQFYKFITEISQVIIR